MAHPATYYTRRDIRVLESSTPLLELFSIYRQSLRSLRLVKKLTT